jgi:hypothetical protein
MALLRVTGILCGAVMLVTSVSAQLPQSGVSTCPAAGADPRELVRRAAENDELNDKRARDYTYTERQVEQKLDRHDRVASTSTETREIMVLDGEFVERVVARDDKPLPPRDAQKEEERINKWLEKRKNESADEKKDRLAKEEKDREQTREFEREIADAYHFKLLPDQDIDGRAAYVLDADPRPDFKPKTRDARILPNFKFRAWVDKDECQLIKLDASVIDTVSVGWFVARLNPGSRFVLVQTRVNDEVWLASHIDLRLEARVLLLKGFNERLEFAYSNYQKFRTNIQIVPPTEH